MWARRGEETWIKEQARSIATMVDWSWARSGRGPGNPCISSSSSTSPPPAAPPPLPTRLFPRVPGALGLQATRSRPREKRGDRNPMGRLAKRWVEFILEYRR